MANNFEESDFCILKNVRLDYFDIYTPAPSQDANKKNDRKYDKFKAKAIIDMGSDADNVARAGLMQAATKMWGANAATVVKSLPTNQKALRKGDEYLTTDGGARPEYAGRMFISASNKSRPQVVGQRSIERDGKKIPVEITEDGRAFAGGIELSPPPYEITVPFRGCYVNMKVKFVAGKAGKMPSGETVPNQVFAKLEAIQFVRKGEAFGAGPTSAEGFDDEEVAETADAAGDLF
jgi:hypothetical protein